jgi:3-hydroxybutyryl-CoA dehydrogenase
VIVGIVGAGTMGAGIAQVAATAGHSVLLYDAEAGRADAGRAAVEAALVQWERKGRVTPAERTAILDRIRTVESVVELADAGLIVEAIVESLPVKQQLFADLEGVVATDAILATNTSSLSITEIAGSLTKPERVVGMHYFNPAPVLPLVEVVSGVRTSAAVASRIVELARAWGKVPVRATSTPGFIVNRVARAYYSEPFAAYEEGVAEPATIDTLLRESAGFRMGPFELTDLIGHDVNAAVTESVWEAFGRDARFTPSVAQQELVRDGKLGRKTGEGWFRYDADGQRITEAEDDDADLLAGMITDDVEPVAAAELPVLWVPGTESGILSPLFDRMTQAGIEVRTAAIDYTSTRATGGVLPGLGSFWLTTGRTADDVADDRDEPVVLLDLAEFGTASRVGVAVSAGCPDELVNAVAGMLHAAGIQISVLDDLPGLVVARTLALLISLAADAVEAGVATPDDVDLAMVNGVNYPRGPLEWADRIGPAYVVAVLDALAASELPTSEERYRVPNWLRRRAKRGKPLR